MNRDQLERKIWLALRDLKADRHPLAANIVQNILDDAALYATTREVAFHAALARADTPGQTQLRREALAVAGKRKAS